MARSRTYSSGDAWRRVPGLRSRGQRDPDVVGPPTAPPSTDGVTDVMRPRRQGARAGSSRNAGRAPTGRGRRRVSCRGRRAGRTSEPTRRPRPASTRPQPRHHGERSTATGHADRGPGCAAEGEPAASHRDTERSPAWSRRRRCGELGRGAHEELRERPARRRGGQGHGTVGMRGAHPKRGHG